MLILQFKMMGNSENSKTNSSVPQEQWTELYILTEHWKSDLEFYKEDLLFLHHIIDKYFMWITKPENLDMVKEIKKELFNTKSNNRKLLEEVQKHMSQLGHLVEEANSEDQEFVKKQHLRLEDALRDFVKSFRKNRKEIFKITEYVIDSEHLEQLMQP